MINVLYIEKGLGKGGSSLSLKYLLDALDLERFKPVLLFNGPVVDCVAFDWKDVAIYTVPENKKLSELVPKINFLQYIAFVLELFTRIVPAAYRIILILKKNSINICHLNNDIDSHLAGILACKLTGTPFVCHLRCTRPLTKIEKLFSRWIDAFIALSESGRDFFVAQGITADKILVSFDPYATALVTDGPEKKPDWLAGHESSKKVAIFSRIARGKGHEDFLKAAACIVKESGNVHFFIMGSEAADSPGYIAELRDLARQLGLENYVTFAGWQADVMQSLQYVDIVVDVSILPEGLRRTLVEGMIAGKPVIGTDVGQTRELFEKSGGGLLVPLSAPDTIAEKINYLLNHEKEAVAIGVKGRDYTVDKFDMHQKTKEIEVLYDKLLTKQNSE